MSTPSLIQRAFNALYNLNKPHRNSVLFIKVKAAIKADGCAYVHYNDLGGRQLGPSSQIRMITSADYDRSKREESYVVFNPYTHERSTFTYGVEEAPRASLLHAGNFRHIALTQGVDERLAASYATKAMSLHRVVEWVVGTDTFGNLLTLYSGSRPCDSASLSQGSIINFNVLDAETLKFKHIIHWDYTKGHLWNAVLNPIPMGRPLLSHWLLASEPEESLFNWTFKTQRYVEEDHPHVRTKWGTPCFSGFNYGDLVATPTWVGMVVGECTSETEETVIVVVDFPGRRGESKIKYSLYQPERIFSLVDLIHNPQVATIAQATA